MISNAVRSLIASGFVAIASLFGSSSALAGTASGFISISGTYEPAISLTTSSTNNKIIMDGVGSYAHVGSVSTTTNNFNGLEVVVNYTGLVGPNGALIPITLSNGYSTFISGAVIYGTSGVGSVATNIYVAVASPATVPGDYSGTITFVATDK